MVVSTLYPVIRVLYPVIPAKAGIHRGVVYPAIGDETLYPRSTAAGFPNKGKSLGGGVESASFGFGDSEAEGGERFGLGLGQTLHVLSDFFRGDCQRRYTPEGSRHFHSPKVIDRALAMRAEVASVAGDRRGDGEKKTFSFDGMRTYRERERRE